MTRISSYDFEKYSLFDIQRFVEEKGFSTSIDNKGNLIIEGTDLSVDVPWRNSLALASLRFENYPKSENFEKSEMLYKQLQKKFRKGKEQKLSKEKIKDWDKIKRLF